MKGLKYEASGQAKHTFGIRYFYTESQLIWKAVTATSTKAAVLTGLLKLCNRFNHIVLNLKYPSNSFTQKMENKEQII